MPSPAEVAGLKRLLAQISGMAESAAARLVRSNPEFQNLVEQYPQLVRPYLSAAASVSAQWYVDLDRKSGFQVEEFDSTSDDDLAATAGWAFGQDDTRGALGSATGRLVFEASRETIRRNAENEGVRYARGASDDSCAWCQAIAAEGAVFKSEESATFGHNGCGCIPVPDRDGSPYVKPDWVDGFKSDYADAKKGARAWLEEKGEDRKPNLDDIVNAMRRKKYAED